jgi:hypothetical protein
MIILCLQINEVVPIEGKKIKDELRKAGVIAITGDAFVLIFRLKLKPPEKDD